MRVSIKETEPKTQDQQQQQQQQQPQPEQIIDKHKMKFNWRANWEILLVLVIIVVGIVITTIAAIRNKDKHLLNLPDETDYGQLLASNDAEHQHHMPPLPQMDFQMNSAHTLSSNGDDNISNSPGTSSVNSKRSTSPKVSSQKHKSPRLTNSQQHHAHHVNDKPHHTTSRFEDLAEFNQPPAESAATPNPSSQTGHDFYDALSTEPTPSQGSTRTGSAPKTSGKSLLQSRRNSSGNSIARPVAKSEHQDNDRALIEPSEQLIDDLHTTTRSLSSSSKSVSDSSSLDDSDDSVSPNQMMTSTLHGPYGLMLPSLVSGYHQAQSSSTKQSPEPTTLAADIEDMMTSYTRNPRNNLTDAQLGPDSPEANFNYSSSSSSSLLDGAGNREHHLAGHKYRNHFAATAQSLPFSVLLNDLIKLARPSPLINTQAGSERPANSRPLHSGLLQQLRSLPGPVLALLHNSAASSNELSPATQTHDASESSQHYQQIPVSLNGMHLLSGTNPLPAFAPPNGIQSIWYPPTMGGSASVHDTMNSNADFVASNVAGFVRSSNKLTDGQSASGGGGGGGSSTTTTSGDGSSSSEPLSSHYPHEDTQGHQRQRNDSPSPALGAVNYQMQQYATAPQLQQLQHQHHQGSIAQANAQQSVAVVRGSSSPPNALVFNNQRQVSEMQQMPLGYNQLQLRRQSQLQYQQQQPIRLQYDFSSLSGESAPKASLTSSSGLRGAARQQAQPASNAQSSIVHPTPIQLNAVSRQRRAIENAELRNAEVDEEEELLDSRTVSIVLPDGRPMFASAKRAAKHKDKRHPGQLASSSSHRQVNHQDLEQKALHHYANQQQNDESGQRLQAKNERPEVGNSADDSHRGYGPSKQADKQQANFIKSKQMRKSKKQGFALEAAGSGLMSKLLGTASTNNDELDDEFDGDDEESNNANERRREELEDAEFGIVNDRINSVGPEDESADREVNRLGAAGNRAASPEGRDTDSSVGSGSTDSEAYARRARQQQQQQRADVKFYGHPGEETRQLKYGILGSGNYEVVNGGVYPEADESTAAVNSIANYVRKPGMLLAGLSKLALSADAGSDLTGGGQAAAYVPGGRITSGYMRGASASPDDLVGFVPGAPGLLGAPKSSLLELIDANNGHLFDPNLISQLGSSGSSARTTFTSRDSYSGGGDDEDGDNDELSKRPRSKRRKKVTNATRGDDSKHQRHADDVALLSAKQKTGKRDKTNGQGSHAELVGQQATREQVMTSNSLQQPLDADKGEQSSSSSGSKSQGTNQFYSYHILPSKKVTIFSDQDLDSVPSEQLSKLLEQSSDASRH